MPGLNYIFDVDGVMNTLSEHDIDTRIISQIAQLLTGGKLVALNTGRGYSWVRESIIEPIRQQVKPDQLDNMFVSAEMGGIAVEFKNGQEIDCRTAFSLRPDQIQQVKQVYDRHSHRRVNWFGNKVTMATIVKPEDQDVASFAVDASIICKELQVLFASQHVKVWITADAIEVAAPEAGKWAGAELIYNWIKHKPSAMPNHFICLGDNPVDYEMARFYASQGHTVDFIFTGEQSDEINQDSGIRFFKTDASYSQGTYEFLSTEILIP